MSGGRQEGDDGSGGAKRPSRPTALPGRICSRHCPAAPSPGHFLSHVAAFWGLLSLGDHKKGLCKFDWKWQLFGFAFYKFYTFFFLHLQTSKQTQDQTIKQNAAIQRKSKFPTRL